LLKKFWENFSPPQGIPLNKENKFGNFKEKPLIKRNVLFTQITGLTPEINLINNFLGGFKNLPKPKFGLIFSK